MTFAGLAMLKLKSKHRLLCGDSTNKADVNTLMDVDLFDLMISDLPYGVSYGQKNKFLNEITEGNRNQSEIENDNLEPEKLRDFSFSIYRALIGHSNLRSSYYAFMPQGGEQMMMMQALDEAGFQVKHELIWVKNNHVLGRSDYAYKHEPICYGWPKGKTHIFYAKFKTSVFQYDKPASSKLHPTMKPIELLSELISNSSNFGMIVIDPTAGSGSTIIACEKIDRKCYAMEIDPHYCSVIIQRFIDFCGGGGF